MPETLNLEPKVKNMHPMLDDLTKYLTEISPKHGSGFLEGEETWDDKDIQDAASLLTAFAVRHERNFDEVKALFEKVDSDFESDDLGVFAIAQMTTALF